MTKLYEKMEGGYLIFWVVLFLFSTISLATGDYFAAQAASGSSAGTVQAAPDDLGDDVSDDGDTSEKEDIVIDEDGTVYIDGIAIEDGTVLEDGTVVSIEDVPGDEDETDPGASEDEPFALNIPFVDLQTSVAFLPTEEGLELQKRILNSKTRDSEIRGLLPDGRVELTIHIAPGMMVQSELPLKFGLELRKGMYADLLVWNSDIEQFADVLTVEDVGPEVEKSVALTLLLPPELIERLKGNVGTASTFNIVSWIDGTSEVVEVSELNIVDMPDRFTEDRDDKERKSTRSDDAINWSRTYDKNFANKNFGAGISAHASAKLNEGGAFASADAKANVYILGKDFEILGAEGKAQAIPHNMATSSIDLDVRFLKKSIWSFHKTAAFEYKDKISFAKDVHVSTTICIFFFPVTFTGGARGELGLQWQLGVNENLYAKIGPFVDVSAYGSAKVSLIIAWVGVKGTLDPLIKDEFWGQVTCSMKLIEGGCKLWGNLNFMVWNELFGPHGKFGPIAGYRKPSICYKKICIWGCIKVPYPCLKKEEKWWVLVDWNSYHRKDTLVNWNKSATIKLMDGCDPTQPILSLNPTVQKVNKPSGKTMFNVSNLSGAGTMNWTAVTNGTSWLTIDSGSSGTNDGTITVSFDSNDSGSERTGTITVTAPGAKNSPQTIQVIQSTKEPEGGVALDMDISTKGYDDTVSETDIESETEVSVSDEVWVGVVAQNVKDLDTLQVEVSFDSAKVQYMGYAEDDPADGTKNFLKKKGASVILMVFESGGKINITGSLSSGLPPEGSGIVMYLKFKVLNTDSDNKLTPGNAFFTKSNGEDEGITNLKHGAFVNMSYPIGDFNEDGVVTKEGDLPLLQAHWLLTEDDPGWDPKYDLDPTPLSGKGIINYKDLHAFTKLLSP